MIKKGVALLATNWFFYGIILVLVLSSLWIALSGRYPMAFDEDFHLGIIKLYAEQWSPFFGAQPAGADTFGAVVRDPSYLHHYLLSFPYRLTNGWFHSDFINIMVLRGIGIGFMVAGVCIFRSLLRRVTDSSALINAVLLCFVLTPVVPFLSGQINYDNMLFPISGLVLLLSLQVRDGIRAGRPQITPLVLLLSVAILGCLTKYAFLPVFFGVVVFLGLEVRRAVARRNISLASLLKSYKRSIVKTSTRARVGLAAIFVASTGLFVAMYGYNFVAYKTPIPECNQVIGAERCTAYGAWFRNYQYAQNKGYVNPNPITFTTQWATTYLTSGFFAVNGIYSGFIIGPPLPVLHMASIVAAVIFVPLVVWRMRHLWQSPGLRLFIVVIAIYGTALWVQNYSEYINLGQHVAEHGRYWVILLVPVYAVLALAVRSAVRSNQKAMAGVFVLTLLTFTQGGGALTYIARSDDTWWWQNNAVAPALNNVVKPIVKPLMIGSGDPNIKPWEVGK